MLINGVQKLPSKLKAVILTGSLILCSSAFADMSVPMYFTSDDGQEKLAGTIVITETQYGLLFTPNLQNMTPGLHGFHVHTHPNCSKNGMDAGDHFDPKNTGQHMGPYDDTGHLGDLPVLYVKADGTSSTPVLAPRIMHVNDIKNHALMIHEGGDNYSDQPEKTGGGGKRMVCGVIKD